MISVVPVGIKKNYAFWQQAISKRHMGSLFCDPFRENLKTNVNVHMQPCKE